MQKKLKTFNIKDKNLLTICKETVELEAAALLDFANTLPFSIIDAISLIKDRSSGRVVCTGMGKSGHIASKVSATLMSTGTPSQFLHPAEATHGDLGLILPTDVLLAFSNSGETEEIIRILPYFKDYKIPVIAVVGNKNSTLSTSAEVAITYTIEREACPHNLAPTSSTTLSLAIGDAIAIALMKDRDFQPIDFARFHPGGSLGKKLLGKVRDFMSPCPIIAPTDDLLIASKILITEKALVAAVVDNNMLIGALTLGDIVRNFADNAFHLDNRKFISDLMSKSPKSIHFEESCANADLIMSRTHVNSLIVIDDNNLPIGSYLSTNM